MNDRIGTRGVFGDRSLFLFFRFGGSVLNVTVWKVIQSLARRIVFIDHSNLTEFLSVDHFLEKNKSSLQLRFSYFDCVR